MMRRFVGLSCVILAAVALLGCAAMETGLKYKDLDTQTRMSDSIFLDPIAPEKRLVWIEVKNTSDKELNLSAIAGQLSGRGWRIVSDPQTANVWLQINILYAGKTEQAAIEEAMSRGFGGGLAGVAAGTVIGTEIGREDSVKGPVYGALLGGLFGQAAEIISGSLVKKVTYGMVTDVQMSIRTTTPVTQQQRARLEQGTQTVVTQRSAEETTNWMRYRTRVGSSAVKVNLEFGEAQPSLEQGLARSIAGLL